MVRHRLDNRDPAHARRCPQAAAVSTDRVRPVTEAGTRWHRQGMLALATGPRRTPSATRTVPALVLLTLLTLLALLASLGSLTAITMLVPRRALAAPGPRAPDGPWRWPLPVLTRAPEVTRGFDPPSDPYGPGHRGVDLAAAAGTSVLAAGPGMVGYAGNLAGRGVVTVVHPAGLETTYEPVRPAVRAGQRVAEGDVLGTLQPGHTGCPRAACLHWGLLRGHSYLDPLSLLRRPPVRLLPLDAPAPTPGPPSPPARVAAVPASDDGTASALRRAALPWARPGMAAAIGLAVAGGLALSRRRR